MPAVPYDLPDSPLPATQAATLCFAFEAEVRALEQVLIAYQRTHMTVS